MLRVAFYERLDEGGFADAWGPDYGDDDGGSLFGKAVDKRGMKALFFDLGRLSALLRMEGI